MKTILYNYRSGREIVPKELLEGVIRILEGMDHRLGKYEIRRFKDRLSDQLQMQGWPGPVNLSAMSSITITSLYRRVGLCAQTGNMARMYADLLKLQALYLDENLKAAIYLIPTKACANAFGGNVANYERFLNELRNIFSRVITVPMVVIGFDNEKEASHGSAPSDVR